MLIEYMLIFPDLSLNRSFFQFAKIFGKFWLGKMALKFQTPCFNLDPNSKKARLILKFGPFKFLKFIQKKASFDVFEIRAKTRTEI